LQQQNVQEQIATLRLFKDALTKGITLVAIVVNDEEDAYDIFETLNDRGLRLSVPDLVVTSCSSDAQVDQKNILFDRHGILPFSRWAAVMSLVS
jgi:hypothetical protein